MEKVLIKLEKICFHYFDHQNLINDLDFILYDGEKIGITGKNGSGKTTLLYLIVGLLKPKKGRIEIFGKAREKEEDFKEIRKEIGFLFQNPDYQIFCPSLIEEVAFGLLNRGIEKEKAKERAREFLKIFGLNGKEFSPTYYLSEGEKKRLALAEILVLSPKILILDEPTNDLDEEGIEILISFLKKPEISAIIVSQDKEFLNKVCTKIYEIVNGKLKKL